MSPKRPPRILQNRAQRRQYHDAVVTYGLSPARRPPVEQNEADQRGACSSIGFITAYSAFFASNPMPGTSGIGTRLSTTLHSSAKPPNGAKTCGYDSLPPSPRPTAMFSAN